MNKKNIGICLTLALVSAPMLEAITPKEGFKKVYNWCLCRKPAATPVQPLTKVQRAKKAVVTVLKNKKAKIASIIVASGILVAGAGYIAYKTFNTQPQDADLNA